MLQTLYEQFLSTSLIEWIAFLFGVAQVLLARKNNRFNFHVGLMSVLLYTYIFYQYALYAEALLNGYYVWISIAGMMAWQTQNGEQQSIRKSLKSEWINNTLLAIFLLTILYFLLQQFTNSTVPLPDAGVAALAWIGSYLLVKRRLENWLWLTASNLIAIPLQIYKGLPLTALLTIIYLIVGLLGYYHWLRLYRQQKQKV